MPEKPHLDTVSPYTLGGTWIVTYLALHMFWMQHVFGPYSFLTLRIPFLIAAFSWLLWRNRETGLSASLHYLRVPSIGATVTFSLLTLATRFLLHWIHPFDSNAPSLRYIADNVIIAPVNEELLFRLLFLQILIDRLGLPQIRAVLLSALIFAVCHTNGVISPFVGGIIYGFACIHPRGGLLLAIACHAFWNTFTLVFVG